MKWKLAGVLDCGYPVVSTLSRLAYVMSSSRIVSDIE